MALGRCIFGVLAACALAPAGASAATLTVAPDGGDFQTISAAAAAARSGDTVVVSEGRYRETINLSADASGVTFRAAAGDRPVIDGEGVRDFGFYNNGANDLVVSGFEITGQKQAGIYTKGLRGLVKGNVIHHLGSAAETHTSGVRVVRGRRNEVVGNTIHHVSPGHSTFGVWLVETRDARVADNTIYLIRKEGVRDWKGLDNTITGNRVFLSWSGIGLNTSTGSTVTDNFVYDTVEGLAVKHASYSTVLDYWDLDSGHWSRVVHNTVFRSTEASLWVGQSDEPLDLLEVSDNLFSGAGTAFLRDSPSLRGPNVTVHGNAYSDTGGRPRWLYKAGWSSAPGLSDWQAVRQATGWENAGTAADAGARGVEPADVSWTPFGMVPVDSSSKGTFHTRTHLVDTSDNDQSSYWLTAGNLNEYVTFDFGRERTFNHLILTLYSHDDVRNPRGYRFDVSSDGVTWRTVHAGVNGDTSGAARYYELSEPASARYLRLTLVDTFCASYAPPVGCGEYFVVSDVKAGMLGSRKADDAPAAPDSTDNAPEGDPLLGIDVQEVLDLLPGGDSDPEPPADAPELARSGLEVARTAALTARGRLRLPVRCVGAFSGRARINVAGRSRGKAVQLGRTRPTLGAGCSRVVQLRVRRSALDRLSRGRVRKIRVTTQTPGAPAVTTPLQVQLDR